MIQQIISQNLRQQIMNSMQTPIQNIYYGQNLMNDQTLLYLQSLKIQYQNQILWQIISKLNQSSYVIVKDDYKINTCKKHKQMNKTYGEKTEEDYKPNQEQQNHQEINKHYKNDTKNIPKNFGKAIITFVQKNPKIISRLLKKENINYSQYLYQLKKKKKDLNTIANLRELWCQELFAYARVTRMISIHYLKRGSLNYVFNSRIENHMGHIKYRNRLIQAVRKPEQFTNMKIF